MVGAQRRVAGQAVSQRQRGLSHAHVLTLFRTRACRWQRPHAPLGCLDARRNAVRYQRTQYCQPAAALLQQLRTLHLHPHLGPGQYPLHVLVRCVRVLVRQRLVG